MSLDAFAHFLQTAEGIGTAIVTLCGIGSACAVFIRRRVVLPLRRWVSSINKAVAQLAPNGGSSVFDTIKRIDARQDEIVARTMAIQDSAPNAIFECSASGACTFANRKLSELFGMDWSEMQNNGWLQAIRDDDRERVYEKWHHAVANDIPYRDEYTVVNQRTGALVRCVSMAKAMKDRDGKTLGYYGTVMPIDGQT